MSVLIMKQKRVGASQFDKQWQSKVQRTICEKKNLYLANQWKCTALYPIFELILANVQRFKQSENNF